MMLLYHSTHSTCSQKVRLCLAEKKLPWTGEHLNLRRFDQLKPEFLAINHAGMVPVLVDDRWVADGSAAFTLHESRVINEYLEETYPEVRLVPEDPRARARMRLWTKFSDDVATDAVKLPSFVKNIQPELQRLAPEEVRAMVAKIPDPKVRERWTNAVTKGISAADLQPSIERLTGMIERMDRSLRDGQWLAGDQYSLADIDIAPFVHRLIRCELFYLVEARPRVADWYERISSRPAYASAIPPAGSEGVQPGG
ncbi:MAG: glutathione S-transferase family protein [Burkholderiales bacterium]